MSINSKEKFLNSIPNGPYKKVSVITTPIIHKNNTILRFHNTKTVSLKTYFYSPSRMPLLQSFLRFESIQDKHSIWEKNSLQVFGFTKRSILLKYRAADDNRPRN